MIRNFVYLILLLSILLGCIKRHGINEDLEAQYINLDSNDYSVASAAISHLIKMPIPLNYENKDSIFDYPSMFSSILINDSTSYYDIQNTQYFSELCSKYPNFDSSLFVSYQKNNKLKYLIENKFELEYEVKIIGNAEIDTLLHPMAYKGFLKLYKKYPNAYGMICFSRPGYSKNNSIAFISISTSRDPKNAVGYFMILKKLNNEWLVINEISNWIS